MRIAIYNVTTLTYIGGLETFCLEIAKVFARRGHEVHQISGVRPPRIEEHIESNGMHLHVFPFRHMDRFPNFGTRFRKMCERIFFARRALKFLASLEPEVVIIQKPYDFPILGYAKRFKNLRAKVHYHSAGEDFFPGDGATAGAVDIWTSVSADNAGRVGKKYGRAVKVIPYGVDCEAFKPDGDGAVDAPGPADQNVIYIGRLAGLKGVLVLIKAWRHVAKEIPAGKLVIVGEGPQEIDMLAMAKDYGIADRILFLGPRPHADLPAYYRSAGIFVYPTIVTEALGFGLLEAGACGRAIVASDIGGMPEVLSGGAGLLVPPRNDRALADALIGLLKDPGRRKILAEAAHRRMTGAYSWENTAAQFESLYR